MVGRCGGVNCGCVGQGWGGGDASPWYVTEAEPAGVPAGLGNVLPPPPPEELPPLGRVAGGSVLGVP